MSLLGRRHRDEEEDQKSFWLEFQVCSDGLGPPSSSFSPSSSPPSPATFALFPELPTELRLQIWESLLRPRIVIAACFDTTAADDDDAEGAKRAQLARRARLRPVPALLHVCRETRRLALGRYELAFAWRVPAAVDLGPAPAPAPGPSPGPSPAGRRRRRRGAPAAVWFDFARDALLLLGALEPYDRAGVNAPMVYFLDRADARRVRHVACAFEELRLGGGGAGDGGDEEVFGSLFHVVDGFPGAERLVITSTDEDLRRRGAAGSGMPLDLGLGSRDNIVQKIWWGWVNGTSVVTSHLRDKQILMVREDGLADFVAEHI